MTHETDCTVKDQFRDEITEAAKQLYYQQDRLNLRQLAADNGWVLLGSGVARTAFQVSFGNPDVTDATNQAPCVIKFAREGRGGFFPGPGNPSDGRIQNQEEIDKFKNLPDELIDPEIGTPVFAPLKDWDRNEKLWVSLPHVDDSRGSTHEVKGRLVEKGWVCEDIKPDNVGLMHGESVLIDYGLPCEPAKKKAEEDAEELVRLLDRPTRSEKVQIESIEAGSVGVRYTVEFLPPAFTHGDRRPFFRSRIRGGATADDKRTGVSEFEIIIGEWHPDRIEKVENGEDFENKIELVGQEWLNGGVSVVPERFAVQTRDDSGFVYARFKARMRGEWVPPDIAIGVYDGLLTPVEEQLPVGEQVKRSTPDLQSAVEDAVSEAMSDR
jgi:hypothetical protein